MIYIIACIISSTLIYVLFKIAKHYQSDLTQIITINYLAASILGFFLFQSNRSFVSDITVNQTIFATIVGVLFIVMFFLIGLSSQKTGIAVTTLANKLSVVFPVLFSLIYFNESITLVKYLGLILALFSISLIVIRNKSKDTRKLFLLFPLFIFIGSGITDSTVKYVQEVIISENNSALFSTQVFIVSFILAVFVLLLKKLKKSLHISTIIIGTFLGAVNFGSLYFLINALNKSGLESSLVFTIINISIVSLSAIVGVLLFNEKLNKLNYLGIFLALVSLYLLAL